MKVLFLDIDGVVKPGRSYWLYNDMNGSFDPLSVAAINQICRKTGAGIVFNSTWSGIHGLDGMKNIALSQGILAPIYGRTDYPKVSNRLIAIEKWLAQHDTEMWCALDDAPIDHNNAIRVDPLNGVSVENYRLATKLLGNKDSFIIFI